MKQPLLILLISVSSISLFAQAPLKGPLDGRTYETDVTKEGKKKPMDPDEFKFTGGKFKSRNFGESYGFKKQVPYLITSIDSSNAAEKIYTWKAESINDIKETLQWQGTIQGDQLEGTGDLISAKGEKKWSYTFTGKLKKKPGQK
jgi:hypothetical protein